MRALIPHERELSKGERATGMCRKHALDVSINLAVANPETVHFAWLRQDERIRLDTQASVHDPMPTLA